MSILEDLQTLVKTRAQTSPEMIARAVRRMKRDRLTIRKMQERLRWYDAKVTALVNELKRRAALSESQQHPSGEQK